MIEQATAFAATPREDTGYKSWQASVKKAVMRLDPNDRTAGPIPTFGSMIHNTMDVSGAGNAYAPASATSADPNAPDIAYTNEKESNEYTFDDVLDIINPLQHLPVIGTIYRKLSGDTIKGMSTILGGALFGGPIGAVAGAANVIVKDRTGKDIAENAFNYAGFGSYADAPPRNSDIVYAETPVQNPTNLAATTLYEKAANTNDGHKNFSAAHVTRITWNA